MNPGSWVLGFLAENVWSVAGDDDADDVSMLSFQVIMNYNLSNGWYLTSGPVITANWEAESDNRWTVPIGGGFGKIMRWGKQAVDGRIQAFYNVAQPEPGVAQLPNIQNQGDTWSLQVQIKLLFTKKPDGLPLRGFHRSSASRPCEGSTGDGVAPRVATRLVHSWCT